MKKQVAQKVLETTSECSIKLSELVPYLKSNCENQAEYETLAKKVAKAMASIYFEINSKIYEEYPELKPSDRD